MPVPLFPESSAPSPLFSPRANVIARAVLVGVAVGVPVLVIAMIAYGRSPYFTGVGVMPMQPVPFSHAHHVSGLGIDCRYCHVSVEESPFAGMPATETCMSCHWQMWTESEMLAPVRESWATNTPIRWRRIHNLPDFVYFNHAIHVNKGVGCQTCHGEVDRMPLMAKVEPLYMRWCVDCHRDPGPNLRPRSEEFNTEWSPPPSAAERDQLAGTLVSENHIQTAGLTSCSACHR